MVNDEQKNEQKTTIIIPEDNVGQVIPTSEDQIEDLRKGLDYSHANTLLNQLNNLIKDDKK